MTIHVVDNHAPMRASLGALLSGLGFEVNLFASGEELLEAVAGLKPGVLLTDLRMPGMSGLDVQPAGAALRSGEAARTGIRPRSADPFSLNTAAD